MVCKSNKGNGNKQFRKNNNIHMKIHVPVYNTNPYGTVYHTNPYGTVYPTNPYGTVYPTNPYGTVYPTNPYGTVYPTSPCGTVVVVLFTRHMSTYTPTKGAHTHTSTCILNLTGPHRTCLHGTCNPLIIMALSIISLPSFTILLIGSSHNPITIDIISLWYTCYTLLEK